MTGLGTRMKGQELSWWEDDKILSNFSTVFFLFC